MSGQTIHGRISGTVTDSSKAVIPGATVSIVNENTKLTRTAVTDDSGFYVVTNLPVGNYSVTAELPGFKKVTRSGFDLVADGRLTADFVLEPGEISDKVIVLAVAGETVNTTSGEVARVINREQVEDLALNGRNYLQLASLIPGAVLLDEDQMALTTSLSTTNQIINGNRGNTTSLSIDGGFNMDSGSNGSQINNVGVDFVREIKIQTSSFSAEYGRNSGASINAVTRSGENRYHGDLFEFLRNDKVDARAFFSPVKAKLRFNDYGWDFGGPIKKDKLFFFAGQEWKVIRRDNSPVRRTLPTRAERRGDFSQRSGNLRFPGTTTNVPNRDISSLITPDGKAIAAVYDAMEKVAASYVDTPTGNNAVFQPPNPFDWRQELVRIDYNMSDTQRLYGRYLHDDFDLIDPFGTFSGADLPNVPTNRRRPGFSYQVGHNWILNPKLINESKVNASWNGQRIPPVGENWKRSTFGFQYPQLFHGGRYDDIGIPDVSISGFAGFRGPSFALLSPTTDIAFNDNLTWTRGAHTIKGGVLLIRNRKDQNGRPPYTGSASFSTGGNTNTTGNALADALLGNFRTYTEAQDDPIGLFRFWQFEGFLMDSWKAHRNLSLEIGLRYYFGTPIYTQANNIVDFDPTRYDPARAVKVNNDGSLVPGVGNRFNGLVRAGSGVPAGELGRVPNGNSPEVLAVPAGAPRGLYDNFDFYAPRFGFAWTPFGGSRTSVRGGFGMFLDRSEGNLIFSQVNLPPFSGSANIENANLSDPSKGRPAALQAIGNIDSLDPHLKIPYTMTWNLTIQRELPRGFFAEVGYISTQGRHLIRQPDINQAPFDALVANAALPSAQRLSTNALRPYKGYSAIRMRLSDSTSSYNALQVYVNKRKGDLTMTTSYTWSKVLADTSGNGDNPEDPFNRGYSRGPASFDRPHIFVTTYTYRIPFLRHWTGVGGAALSGWEVSGITRMQAGGWGTVTASTSTGTRRAEYIGGNINLPRSERTPDHYFNIDAFAAPPDERRGNGGVGTVQLPGLHLWDVSVRKQFRVREQTKLRFQVDFFNAPNHASFRGLNLNVGSLTSRNRDFGTISSSSGPGRNIQAGLKLNF
ncbi:MAG TPA: carboxypeptidase-like regulatory domain-containing protein [Acidobacteriota bacterium]|nr:carboxypeptidase-like regulatory domain-containing protein [Acidobacteriota bacterium]